MSLYLVKGQIQETHYGHRPSPLVEEIRIVKASSWEEACDRFTKHFENKTSEYSVYYAVISVEAHEEIS